MNGWMDEQMDGWIIYKFTDKSNMYIIMDTYMLNGYTIVNE